jgi:hypothetical protein
MTNMMEYGIVLPQQLSQLRRGLPLVLEDAINELTAFTRRLFASLPDELAGTLPKPTAMSFEKSVENCGFRQGDAMLVASGI